MAETFKQKIHQALANPTLQIALDGNAERRRGARVQAYASLPEDLQTLRERAHAIRAHTIANLEQYLEQFISRAQANGIIVHHAATGDQAVQIVRQIAQRKNARLIAKSKTMVGEEIQLNPALEADGLKVVETDLGEYIVQLRGEPPAHIITPAVHLTRAQVGELFQEKLGIPYTEDIPILTAAARKVLRETFLNTDIGISGVNFGVAESGTLCLLTNEGNGRMVTTLPQVHIALMGIERLVPSLDDLALMLYLLPRSATGQKLTVYTSLIHAPRQEGESDGPAERHLILVDNGRRKLRQGSLAESLYCIRCGACLNVCPVFREIGGHAYIGENGKHTPYPGPIGSVISPALFGQPEFGNLAQASSLCGACQEACPVNIDLPKLLLRVRAGEPAVSAKPAEHAQLHLSPALQGGLRMFAWAAASPLLFGLAQRLAGFFSRVVSPRSNWLHLPTFTGWGISRDFPRPVLQPFHSQFKVQNHVAIPASPSAQSMDETKNNAQSEKGVQLPDIERFAAELTALGGHCVRCPEGEAAQQIASLLHSRNISRIHAWEDPHLPAGLLDSLRSLGIQITHQADPSIIAGLTGALAGVAETGTLVLAGGPGRPHSASLLPEIHLAVFYAHDILSNLAQALSLPAVCQASSTVLVSGPSRTADIEMALTIGVHGPGEVYVFCLE
jgi:L-lactate dehydrogenase complex protein LldF